MTCPVCGEEMYRLGYDEFHFGYTHFCLGVRRAAESNLRFWESRVIKYAAMLTSDAMKAVEASDREVPPAGAAANGPDTDE